MTVVPRALKILLYGFWAVIMTALTYALGAVPLKVLRVLMGRLPYWLAGFALSAAFILGHNLSLGVALLSLVILIGVFEELDDVGFGLMASGFFTLLINSLLAGGAFALWVYAAGSKWHAQLLKVVDEIQAPIAAKVPGLQVNSSDLLEILPSVLVVLWICALYVSVLLEPRLLRGTPVATPRTNSIGQLRGYQLPDVVIWVFTASLLGRFGDFGLSGVTAVSYNVMNVCLVLFFFQGIAVVAKYFETLRLPWIWQILFMGFMVYLSLMVSLLGLMDYWVNFRARLTKRAPTLKPEV